MKNLFPSTSPASDPCLFLILSCFVLYNIFLSRCLSGLYGTHLLDALPPLPLELHPSTRGTLVRRFHDVAGLLQRSNRPTGLCFPEQASQGRDQDHPATDSKEMFLLLPEGEGPHNYQMNEQTCTARGRRC